MNKEIRTLPVELRASGDEESRTIEGVAVVFDSWSRDLGGFTEMIKRGAITQELLDNSDIVMNRDHDNQLMLARWNKGKGTLQLELKDDGLHFRFEAPTTELGNQALYDVRNGNLFECSFCFSIDNDDKSERWYRDNENNLKREINHISGLYDCSLVTHAAYEATSCSARAEEVLLKEEEVTKVMDTLDNEIEAL